MTQQEQYDNMMILTAPERKLIGKIREIKDDEEYNESLNMLCNKGIRYGIYRDLTLLKRMLKIYMLIGTIIKTNKGGA